MDFFRGYTRSEEMTEALGEAVLDALREHPSERLGQLLMNALSIRDDRDLFGVYDETMLTALGFYGPPEAVA